MKPELLVVTAAPVSAAAVQPVFGAATSPGDDLACSAHALLRLVLTDLTGVPSHEHVLDRRCGSCGGPHGRPVLRHPELRVSLSYTPGVVAVAVAHGCDVGVDVERVEATDFAGFDDTALAPTERAPSSADRARAWTRKEAYLKATGRGLSIDPRTVDVRHRTVTGPPRGQLYDVPVEAGLACSAAVLDDRRPRLVVERRSLTS